MTQAEEAQRDAINMVDDQPTEFTWNGGTDIYTGRQGGNKFPDRLGSGGFVQEFDLVLAVPLKKLSGGELIANFPNDDPPTNGDKITIDDEDFEVREVEKDSLGAMLRLGLGSAVQ